MLNSKGLKRDPGRAARKLRLKTAEERDLNQPGPAEETQGKKQPGTEGEVTNHL